MTPSHLSRFALSIFPQGLGKKHSSSGLDLLRDSSKRQEATGSVYRTLGDYWTRLKYRPARSTPTTAPLVSRVKKPRCPLKAPLVMMYSSDEPGNRPNSAGSGSGGGAFSAAARISGLIRSSS